MARPWKVLNVAEKNDAAKELSKVMSRGRFNRVGAVLQLPGCVYVCSLHMQREGFSKFNKIYEFDDFSILGKVY